MTNKINMNFYNNLGEALHYEWDPIGVSDVEGAEGEYDHYLPELYELICKDADKKVLFDYLWQIETQHMGLNGNKEATLEFVSYIQRMSGKIVN